MICGEIGERVGTYVLCTVTDTATTKIENTNNNHRHFYVHPINIVLSKRNKRHGDILCAADLPVLHLPLTKTISQKTLLWFPFI